MGLREFKDSDGVLWQVWSVTAEVLDKRTAAEDYMRDWQDGWLCFEHAGARRRLANFPANWENLPDQALLQLLQEAQAVKLRRPGSTSGEYAQFSDPSPSSATAGAERQVAPPQPDGLADSPATDRRAPSAGGDAQPPRESPAREGEEQPLDGPSR